MPNAPDLVTADELLRYPEDDFRYELVDGHIVRMSPVGYEHGRVVMLLGSRLERHVRARRLGVVLTEVGFTLSRDPDTVRAPDIAFIRAERLGDLAPRSFVTGPPDMAVEVLSPEDSLAEVAHKVNEYLTCGTPLVLVVDPVARSVTVHRRLAPPVLHSNLDDPIDLADVLSGFQCTVRDVFE